MRAPVRTEADVASRALAGARARILIACGVLLTALYLLATLRIPLTEWFPGPGVSLGFPQIMSPDWRVNAAEYAGLVIASFTVYGVAIGVVWRRRGPVPPLLLWGFPVLFVVALLMMYPPTAADIFHYQADARTFWIFDRNPLTVPPAQTGYVIGISWGDQPSPYGPLWTLLTAPTTLLAGEHFLLGLVLLKLLACGFFLGCAWLIYRLVARIRPGWETVAVLAFAWNPFILLRVAGNGHNDLVMMFFVLLALERAERGDWLAAFPALTCSVLLKYVPALLGPMFLLYAWQHVPGGVRDRVRALLPGIGAAALVVLLCYAPFWAGADTFDTVFGEGNRKMITSLPLLVQVRLSSVMSPEAATDAAYRITRGLFLLLYLPLVWQSRRDFSRLLTCSFTALFLYLTVATGWFRPWYVLWPLAIAPLLAGTWFLPLFLAISFFTAFPDLIEQYRGHWDWLNEDYWRAVTAPVVVASLPPLLVWYFGLLVFRSWHFDAPWRLRRDGEGPR